MKITEKMIKDVAEMAIEEIENGDEPYIAVENAVGGIMEPHYDGYEEFCRCVADEVNSRL